MKLIKHVKGRLICQEIGEKIQIVNNTAEESQLIEISSEKLWEILDEEYNPNKKDFRSIADDMNDIQSLFKEDLNLEIDSICFCGGGYPLFRVGNIDGDICFETGCVPYVHLFLLKRIKHPEREAGFRCHLVIDFRRTEAGHDDCPDVRMGIWNKEMNTEDFYEVQRNPLSMRELLNSTVENYKKQKETVKEEKPAAGSLFRRKNR